MTRQTSIDSPPGPGAAALRPPRPDWDAGAYEDSAGWLGPAAAAVLDHASSAGPLAGRHVVDVGCGPGNAALLAALRGARVTGVDPAPRLLGIARAAAADRDLAATFLHGDAADLPLPDGAADAVVSVFGVIFAPDAEEAAAEIARVTAPDGCVVVSAWLPYGPFREAVTVPQRALADVLGDAPAAAFAWHEPTAVADLFAPHGFATAFARHEVALTAPSLDAFMEVSARHPFALAAQAVLEPAGRAAAVEAQMRVVLGAANENPGAFRVTVPYIVATARRV